ncbi:hypothetical protein NUW54_g13699 [Trametes sanguinea]|uniref:Uncharacterized protein n=1 Tax=Trametes sanguinea TaxID=158606 RepID=A0ACC1MJB1_9APHY|nr:hypothetical protein NUW54_g13699 [Trametes sanguinea]
MAPPSPPFNPVPLATMDIDEIDEGSQQHGSQMNLQRTAGKRRVLVDEAHPFELETYISSYSGMSAHQ